MQVWVKENVDTVYNKIFHSTSFGDLIYKSKIEEDSIFLVYEQYTIRNGNYMGISVILEPYKKGCMIHYIASGAARGVLGFDFGVKRDRNRRLCMILENKQMDYEIIKE